MGKNILEQIIELIMGILGKKVSDSIPAQPKIDPIVVKPEIKASEEPIDWSNPKSKVAPRFSVGEALTLQSWGVMHAPSEDEKTAIIGIAQKVSKAGDILEQIIGRKVSINVNAFMRPEKANIPGSKWNGMDYNRYIYETQVWKNLTLEEKAKKTVPKSPHRTGHAIDFYVVGFDGKEKCAQIRQMLLPHLEELGLRMEDIDGNWIHLDDLPVVNKRFFKI